MDKDGIAMGVTAGERIVRRVVAATLVVVALVASTGGAGAQDSAPADAEVTNAPFETVILGDDGGGMDIIGGSDADLKDHPYFAWVTDSSGSLVCGGTLIRNRWVLTAAHCVEGLSGRDVYTVFGYQGADRFADAVPSARVVIHPNYDRSSLDNDIALVRLRRAPDRSSGYIKPARLMHRNTRPRVGTMQTIVGLGRTSPNGYLADQLQEAQIMVKACAGAYGDDNDTDNICAGSLTATSCQGDSGGPLMVGDRVAGIVSYGTWNCIEEYGVYTRVSVHADWIMRTIAARCGGERITVNLMRGEQPTAGDDVIWGTMGDDVIAGSDGNDIICGRGGNDTLRGGIGDDRLIGGVGRDVCIGGSGRDQATGCEDIRGASISE